MANRRRGARAARKSSRSQGFAQLPFAPLGNPYPAIEEELQAYMAKRKEEITRGA